MKILGIETSCDETAAAIVENGTTVLSNVVASQMDIHAKFGGVVPEVAARSHVEVMLPVIDEALTQASCGWKDIDGIAVTKGPGLVGSLLIGTLTAQTLAELKDKPLIPINHVEAHVYGGFVMDQQPEFPLLALIVSGGHTQLVLFRNHGEYEVLGKTRDDAVGEAFDKIAKMIGLPYPGGPAVEAAAKRGDDHAFAFPKPFLGHNSLDFSFSGLKTAVLRTAQQAVGRDFRTPSHELPPLLSDEQRDDIAASFSRKAIDILVERVSEACRRYEPKSIIVAGGVAANRQLRSELDSSLPIRPVYPPINLCTDNAAMIASLGCFYAKAGKTQTSPLSPDPVLSM